MVKESSKEINIQKLNYKDEGKNGITWTKEKNGTWTEFQFNAATIIASHA